MTDRRLRKVVERVRAEGGRVTSQRIARRLSDRLDASELDFPLRAEDIADSLKLGSQPAPTLVRRSEKLVVGWVTTPPGAGSGGHTTMFRMVQALEQAGHTCILYLYDRHGGDHDGHARVIRDNWPWVNATITDVARLPAGDLDACVATSWPTAHVLARRTDVTTNRFYFVQDYEPYFYPRGSEYALAEDTYRFGFHHIALGEMVAGSLMREAGAISQTVPFGCDTNTYTLTNEGSRRGVVLYAKQGADRRGFRLADLALQEFHRLCPDEPIHLYGEGTRKLSFPSEHHGRLTPVELNSLYNQVTAGLAMSFTNVSLVAEELLASGAIPVVNESDLARADLPHAEARFAPPTPSGIANALVALVNDKSDLERSLRAAASVRRDGWITTGQQVARIIEDVSYVS